MRLWRGRGGRCGGQSPVRQCARIGMIGCGHGVGVTHTAIACASYLSSARGYRIAYAEISEVSALTAYITGETVLSGRAVGYDYKGVDYYPSVGTEGLADIDRRRYDAIICDYGVCGDESYRSFMGCDRRLVIGSMRQWKYEEYRVFMRDYYIKYGTLRVEPYGLFLRSDEKRRFKSEFGLVCKRLGFISDPYLLEAEELSLMRDITAGWI